MKAGGNNARNNNIDNKDGENSSHVNNVNKQDLSRSFFLEICQDESNKIFLPL